MSGIGLPDWYNIKKAGAISALGDLGELAVRLGSPVTFDRRGDVIFIDSFEEGLLKWSTEIVGSGAAVALSHDAARCGGWSCKLTAGAQEEESALISHYIPYPVLGRLGFECSFAFDNQLKRLVMSAALYDGDEALTATVQYNYADKKLQYLGTDLAWHDVATGLDLYLAGNPFWIWKLVVDYSARKFVRLIMNNVEYDVSGIAVAQAVSTVNPCLLFHVANYTLGGSTRIVYIDDVIVYQNEP